MWLGMCACQGFDFDFSSEEDRKPFETYNGVNVRCRCVCGAGLCLACVVQSLVVPPCAGLPVRLCACAPVDLCAGARDCMVAVCRYVIKVSVARSYNTDLVVEKDIWIINKEAVGVHPPAAAPDALETAWLHAHSAS
jgi:hypothetical protein